jgi:hypothetical protein
MTFANVPLLFINSDEFLKVNFTASYPESTSPTFVIKPFLHPEEAVTSYRDAINSANKTNSTAD